MPNVVDLRFRVPRDPRPMITCGCKDNGRPKGLDHWNVLAYPEIIAAYGPQPKELLFYLPGTPEEMTRSEYSTWGSNNKRKRVCDGSECTHRIPATIAGVQCAAGEVTGCLCKQMELPQDHPDRCRFSGQLSVLIADPATHRLISPSVYQLGAHSKTSYESFWSVLIYIAKLYGKDAIAGTLYGISIQMVSRADNASRTFPVWRARAVTIGGRPLIAMPDNAPVGTLGSGSVGDPVTDATPAPPPAPASTPTAVAPTAVDPQTDPQSIELRVINTPPPGTPIIPEHEMEEYDRAGRTLYGEEWPTKRQAYIHNRTDCQAATRSMEVVIAKREAKLTEQQWLQVLKLNQIKDGKLPPMIGNSLKANLMMDIKKARRQNEFNDGIDEYESQRAKKWRTA